MKSKVQFVLSVDWEGNSLLPENLQAMRQFAHDFPQIPVVHFINPAYFANLEAVYSFEETAERIRSGLGEGHELGLHIHPWEKFVKHCGIVFRDEPSYMNGGKTVPFAGLPGGDIPITAYTEKELEQLMGEGLKLLHKAGFSPIKYFRGGGWVSGEKVFRNLLKFGIKNDSSPVPYKFVSRLYPDTPLEKLAAHTWSHIGSHSGPYRQRVGEDFINIYPDNICLADYLDEEQSFEIFQTLIKEAREQRRGFVYFHYGWHQETAVRAVRNVDEAPRETRYLLRVRKTLEQISSYCEQQKIDLLFPRLDETLK